MPKHIRDRKHDVSKLLYSFKKDVCVLIVSHENQSLAVSIHKLSSIETFCASRWCRVAGKFTENGGEKLMEIDVENFSADNFLKSIPFYAM